MQGDNEILAKRILLYWWWKWSCGGLTYKNSYEEEAYMKQEQESQ